MNVGEKCDRTPDPELRTETKTHLNIYSICQLDRIYLDITLQSVPAERFKNLSAVFLCRLVETTEPKQEAVRLQKPQTPLQLLEQVCEDTEKV